MVLANRCLHNLLHIQNYELYVLAGQVDTYSALLMFITLSLIISIHFMILCTWPSCSLLYNVEKTGMGVGMLLQCHQHIYSWK